jgi:hypothetical protein
MESFVMPLTHDISSFSLFLGSGRSSVAFGNGGSLLDVRDSTDRCVLCSRQSTPPSDDGRGEGEGCENKARESRQL